MKMPYKNVDPTALICAKIRGEYTNIPYAKEISDKLEGPNPLREFSIDGVFDSSLKLIVSVIEGRYLSIEDVLGNMPGPIFEFASGLSPRGISYSGKRNYIETDLEDAVMLKENLVERTISGGYENRLLSLNPLKLEELKEFSEKYLGEFESNLIILNEGLLMHLSKTEQERLRDNLGFVLQNYSPGGSWITTDFSSRDLNIGRIGFAMGQVEGKTGKKFNKFESDEEVNSFLNDGGLVGEPISNFSVLDRLSCLERLDISRSDAETILDLYRAWKISLK